MIEDPGVRLPGDRRRGNAGRAEREGLDGPRRAARQDPRAGRRRSHGEAFQACLKAPFATLGITHLRQARDRHPVPRAFGAGQGAGARFARVPRVRAAAGLSRGRALRVRLAARACRHAPSPAGVGGDAAHRPRARRAPMASSRSSWDRRRGPWAGPVARTRYRWSCPCHRVIGANRAIGGFMGARDEGFERRHQALAAGA